MKKEISPNEATTESTKWKTRAGKSRKITAGGEPVTDLPPNEIERLKEKIRAVRRLQAFIRSGRIKGANINRLKEEGRQ
jgi:hypothetical protein